MIILNAPAAGAPIAGTPPGVRGLPPPVVRPIDYQPRDALPAGLLLTREAEAALVTAWQAEGGLPLTADEAIAAAGAPLPYPTGLPRLPRDGGCCP